MFVDGKTMPISLVIYLALFITVCLSCNPSLIKYRSCFLLVPENGLNMFCQYLKPPCNNFVDFEEVEQPKSPLSIRQHDSCLKEALRRVPQPVAPPPIMRISNSYFSDISLR